MVRWQREVCTSIKLLTTLLHFTTLISSTARFPFSLYFQHFKLSLHRILGTNDQAPVPSYKHIPCQTCENYCICNSIIIWVEKVMGFYYTEPNKYCTKYLSKVYVKLSSFQSKSNFSQVSSEQRSFRNPVKSQFRNC